MKAEEIQALIAYRMQRANETLEEARLMQREEHWNACANRIYYAAFYAVSALLVQDGYTASKHSGVRRYSTNTISNPGSQRKKTVNFITPI